MKTPLLLLALSLAALAPLAGGCASSTDTDDPTASSEDALKKFGGRGPRLGYSCEGLRCTCSGDDDCNDMFSDGVCGDVSTCDTTDELNPRCECIIVLGVKRPAAGIGAPPPSTLKR